MPSVLNKRGGKYPVQYSDASGRRRQVSIIGSKRDALNAGLKLERDAQSVRLGTADPNADALALHAARPLREHVAAFERDQLARDTTPKHARSVLARLRRVLVLAKVARLSDVTESSIRAAADAMRRNGRALLTCRHHVRAVTQFTIWAKRDGRIAANPLADFRLVGFNPERDRRRPRRELTDGEIARLLAHLDAAPPVRRVPAPDRRAFYLVALCTGLRVGELRTLTPSSFRRLDVDDPTIHLPASATKNGRAADQPVPRHYARLLLDWLADRPADVPVFSRFWKPTELLRPDLEAAEVPYIDSAGEYVDCHALRHTFISRLAGANVPVKDVQTLARHSDPRLTIGRYSHSNDSGRRAAVNRAAPVLHSAATHGPDATRLDTNPPDGEVTYAKSGTVVMARDAGNEPVHPEGLEPPTCGSVDRRSIQLS